MRQPYSLFVPALLSLAMVALAACPSFSQRQVLPGRVQQNHSLPPDVFAAGGAGAGCNWHMGACDLLHAYLSQGRSDSRCLNPLNLGVDLERRAQELLKNARQSYEVVKSANDLQQERDRVLAKLPRDCFAAANDWLKPVKSPDDIPIGPLPFNLPKELEPFKDLLDKAIKKILQQGPKALLLGADWPEYARLEESYLTGAIVRSGFEIEMRALIAYTPNSVSTASFNNALARLRDDLRKNRDDMNNIRQQAMALIQKVAARNPGLAADNGAQTMLNDDFPPVQ